MIYNTQSFLNDYQSSEPLDLSLQDHIAKICENVKEKGDLALYNYNKQFDQVEITQLEIPKEEMKQAYDDLDADLKKALHHSYERIKTYQAKIRYTDGDYQSEMYEVYRPIESVGVYVPGGKASYPSTVLMTVTLAQVAGVKNITVVTPPQSTGIAKSVLAACYITGVNHIYQVGGAQSIAALAYGTETIDKVDKIVGPGNQYVAYAKKLLYGIVGIDQIAGPSEIALIIDASCDIDAVAYDVLAQAEHDELARTFVISTDHSLLSELSEKIQYLSERTERQSILKESLKNHHYLIHTNHFDESCQVMNKIAPEHASIQTKSPEDYVPYIHYVGSLFLGSFSPEVMGDYIAGPSHVLPTNRTARFQHGLSVNDFLTKHTVIHLSQQTFKETYVDASQIAQEEQLYNHRHSLLIRKGGLQDDTNE